MASSAPRHAPAPTDQCAPLLADVNTRRGAQRMRVDPRTARLRHWRRLRGGPLQHLSSAAGRPTASTVAVVRRTRVERVFTWARLHMAHLRDYILSV